VRVDVMPWVAATADSAGVALGQRAPDQLVEPVAGDRRADETPPGRCVGRAQFRGMSIAHEEWMSPVSTTTSPASAGREAKWLISFDWSAW